ncbi:MAG: BamA/TamA family outer membrane protein [Bacteroidales bacterium]|nr:BamA/TamA family outer membrane protein [Bacteroidales bacterium]
MKLRLYIIVVLSLVLASCSTTRRIPAGEKLYTGVKALDITPMKGEKVPSGMESSLSSAINVKPNNPLLGSYKYRTPFPVGLWVYNNWSNPPKGLKHWLYEKLVAEPVLVSDVRPEVRVKMLDEILDNNGYFRGSASYELISGKNSKKAKIKYNVVTGPEYTLSDIQLLPDTCHLYHVIDSVAGKIPYLSVGSRYSTDSLSASRTQIANALRNRGYYYFRPEYIEYLADSTITPTKIALRLTIATNTPRPALMRFRTGTVTTYVFRYQGGGTPDTTMMQRGMLIEMEPVKFRKQLVDDCVTFRNGKYFSVRDMDRTQTYFSRLGIFSGISIDVAPDTTAVEPTLDVAISCTMDKPLEVSVEVNASSKSNSYIGPGLTLGFANRNLFGGGEILQSSLTGSYEWQTGHSANRSLFNSYEVGLNESLSFPRLLAPRFIRRSRRAQNWTRITLGADLLNRPHYFEMAQFNTSFNYDWRATRHASCTWTLLKLTYTNLMHTTEAFDSVMALNPAVALSFQSQFIPQMIFSYTYDRNYGYDNTLNFTFTAQEAGNLCDVIWRASGVKGEKKLFGTPLSQFVKGTTQLVYGRRIGHGDRWLVSRAFVGAAHAYGNSSQVPYSEQFYCGGANSVRAFTVRSIGPGSYRPPASLLNGYFDQTGTFKFEFNVEYRFPLLGPLHGAVFFDSGNVWLLKNDPARPGGVLKASTFFKDLATGTGVGLRFDISMLVIRGDLGIGIHAPYDTGRSGYYNMKNFGSSLAFHLAIGYPF